MGEWDRWRWLIYIRVWVGRLGLYYPIVIFVFFICVFPFYCLMSSVSFFTWLDDDRSCFRFFVYLFSLSLVSLIRSHWCIEIVKLFIKSVSYHGSVDFLGKGRVFWFESLFRVSTLLYKSTLDFKVKFIILACRFANLVH